MRSKDFLEQKNKSLSALAMQQNSALSMVNNTITMLQNNNEEIAAMMTDIDEYRSRLESKAKELSDVKDKNTRIIENFKRLIEG